MRVRSLLVALLGFIGLAGLGFAQENLGEIHSSENVTNEQAMNISVEYGLSEFSLRPGSSGQAFNVDIEYENENLDPRVMYEVRNRTGFLRVISNEDDEENHVEWRDRDESVCDITFNPDLPTEIDVELGLGDSDIELGGARLTNVEISSGLSETQLDFSQRNRAEMERLDFEVGLGKFRGKNLSNARFSELDLEVGLGSATLDFHGNGRDRSRVDVSVGLGSVTIIIPDDVGAQILVEKSFLSGVSLDNDFRQNDDVYYSSNWNNAEKRIIVDLEIGLGSASVERLP